MATNLNLTEIANEIEKNLPSGEFTLGKGLLQPFNESNSGSRKIMQGIQKEQSIQLLKPETPLIMTGYENQFGYLSSGFVTADSDYVVITKIIKNKNKYCVLLHDINNNQLHCIMRVGYVYHTEYYGYDLNTSYLDKLRPQNMIPKGTPMIYSASFDDELNKQDGVNLTTVYMNLGRTTEDPIVLSESAAKKFTSPLYHSISIIINDNDIPLNLYGNDEYYKVFPDIGEQVKNGILCAIRRERKDDEALYSQSKERLKEIMISDVRYICNGEVIDIDVYCNNVEKLNDIYNTQLEVYYRENMDYSLNLYNAVNKFMKDHPNCTMTYDMQKEYYKAKDTVNDVPYIKEKAFNNICCDIIVRDYIPVNVGDKITDRYGGKGVISAIIKDEKMPMYFRHGTWNYVDAIYNQCTVINRENPGQLNETEITYIGSKLVEKIAEMWSNAEKMDDSFTNNYNNAMYQTVTQAEEWLYTYYSIINPDQAKDFHENVLGRLSFEERQDTIWSIIQDGELYLVITPMRNIFTIDTLRQLYNAFPFIRDEDDYLYVHQKDSNGVPRLVKTRRPMVIGKKYIYRLKQLAEEKFSAVSLASTNIKGENTKTKANKLHISAISKTPVRFGNMEASELMQLKYCQYTIEAFMMLSTSPIARRLMRNLLTGDPFDRNITLDGKSKSRNVEIVNAYLKAMGLRLVFKRKPKKIITPITIYPVCYSPLYGEPTNKDVVKVTPFVTEEGIKKAIKTARKIYYKDKEIKKDIEADEHINEVILNLAQTAMSDKDLQTKVKEVNTFNKLHNVVFIDAVELYGGDNNNN